MLLLTFFTNKILNVREELQLEKNSVDNQFPEPSPYHGTMFCEFEPVTTNELSELIRTSGRKSCALDPIPASVLMVAWTCCYRLLLRL